MIELSCHCGAVTVRTAHRPEYVNECNCGFCGKAGAWWAYADPATVTVAGTTRVYCRGDKTDPAAAFQFCETCGALTHFVLTPAAIARFGNATMGVNMRLAAAADLAGLELRYPDGRNWSGEGPFGYTGEARVL